MSFARPLLVPLSLLLMLSACTGQNLRRPPTQTDGRQVSNDGQFELREITPKLVAMDAASDQQARVPNMLTSYQPGEYHIGAGDTLYITVWDHPELTVPAGPQQQPNLAGHLVQSDGRLFYPYIGPVQAAGKTPTELRQTLTAQLAKYVESPQVDVSVLTYASQRVFVTGAVMQAAPIPLNVVPLTLSDALSHAGFNPSEADLSGVQLTRDGTTYALDAGHLGSAPIYLKDSDQIYVPFLDQKEVFVVGEVNAPGAMNFKTGSISLSQALGRARGLNQTTSKGNAVYVIRGAKDLQHEPSAIYQLEAKNPAAFAVASHFQLQPGDVVFVGAAGITRWNRFVSQLLPFSSIITGAASAQNDISNSH